MTQILDRLAASAPPVGDIPQVSWKHALSERVVLVDGMGRSGKSLLGPILASFERVEIERVEEIFEYVGALHRMAKIELDAAVALLRLEADMHVYDSLLGRNTNFRIRDHSSVWHTPNPWRYVGRVMGGDAVSAVRGAVERRPIYQNMTHDQLANFPLFHAAFGGRLRVVEMLRHPLDVIDSWLRRGWGERFEEDPSALTLCVRVRDRDVPYYALGWEEAYLAATPAGRVVRIVQRLWDSAQQAVSALSPDRLAQVFFVPFEAIVQQPFPYVEALAGFLGTRPTRATRAAVKRERCPRKYRAEERAQRHSRPRSRMSPEELAIVERLIEEYETVVREATRAQGVA